MRKIEKPNRKIQDGALLWSTFARIPAKLALIWNWAGRTKDLPLQAGTMQSSGQPINVVLGVGFPNGCERMEEG